MYFQRYYLECLSHASYMVADEETGIAAVIDPQRDIDIYVEDAKEHGFKIEHVILTHFHADFVAGILSCVISLGRRSPGHRAEAVNLNSKPLGDGDAIEFGKVRLEALETPGHTPEGMSILVYDKAVDAEQPQSVLTGDTLFIGDVGRPDLLASIGVTADELADMLYDSLHNKLMKLPDATRIYPAHGAGSMCGKNLSDAAWSTIGEQRQYNYALQPMTKEAFKEMVTVDQPEAPDYFVHDAILNRQERPALEESLQLTLKPLDLEQVLELQRENAQLVDVRDQLDFAGGYLRGSLNIGLDGKYATWAGTMLDKNRPIIVIADPGREEEAIVRLGRIGFDNVVGYLRDGLNPLQERLELMQKIERITARALADHMTAGEQPFIIDVRTESELANGRIEGSTNLPLNHLAARLHEIPREQMLVVHCAGGYRSSIATSLLQKHGFENVVDLVGGYGAWKASQLPVVAETTSTT